MRRIGFSLTSGRIQVIRIVGNRQYGPQLNLSLIGAAIMVPVSDTRIMSTGIAVNTFLIETPPLVIILFFYCFCSKMKDEEKRDK